MYFRDVRFIYFEFNNFIISVHYRCVILHWGRWYWVIAFQSNGEPSQIDLTFNLVNNHVWWQIKNTVWRVVMNTVVSSPFASWKSQNPAKGLSGERTAALLESFMFYRHAWLDLLVLNLLRVNLYVQCPQSPILQELTVVVRLVLNSNVAIMFRSNAAYSLDTAP